MAEVKETGDSSLPAAEKAPGATDLEKNASVEQGDTFDPVFLKHADKNDADEAMKAFIGHDGEVIELTPEIERSLLRKIDWNLMPVCVSELECSQGAPNNLSADALCRLWTQLSRQNHLIVRQYYGSPEVFESERRQLPMA